MDQPSTGVIDVVVAFVQWVGVLLVGPAISLAYFLTSPKSPPIGRRILASAHGFAIVGLYALAAGVYGTGMSKPAYGIPFAATLLPLILMVISCFVYRGPKRFHLLRLISLLCLAWTLFVGSMAITGGGCSRSLEWLRAG